MAFSVNVNAQNPTDDATATAFAKIITPIEIAKVNGADLKFGNIIANEAIGTVSVTAEGVVSYSGVAAPSTPGDIQQAQFKVDGQAGMLYTITLPTSATIKDENGTGSNEMIINAFAHNATQTLTGGTETFGVGAVLNVAASQPAGDYQGDFTVTVNYN